jgi:hypothetical protein
MFVSGSNATIIGLSLAGFETAMVLGPAVENTTQRNVGALLHAVDAAPAAVGSYCEYMQRNAPV